MQPRTLPGFRARITLVPTAEGGRSLPWLQGCRPDWLLAETLADGLGGAEVFLEGTAVLDFGQSVDARVLPRVPDFWRPLIVGETLGIYEGPRGVANAVVLSALEPYERRDDGWVPVANH